jgi:hypothetical protein
MISSDLSSQTPLTLTTPSSRASNFMPLKDTLDQAGKKNARSTTRVIPKKNQLIRERMRNGWKKTEFISRTLKGKKNIVKNTTATFNIN